ncbi:variant erythrocyte surface antigen-1 beta subunit [Babesia bovis T2Bo]|uniref:variant erythrocyte surface antigen-1 beta subunit n=1 Tax=Babesia bovis T2Bo TaxID=484906 RepID=UPI001C36B694|nr:variant erythrocyte surface antigen-1 beta subunit [Babesia bovis T2Bo]EDO07798.2 variant erythrocyte surface antigen-1 beta subunit [Babesia bovis T2Bo]
MSKPWTPYDSLTTAPTNLKEAIDWVLRVTGKDGKKNEKPTASTSNGPHCLCYLAKAVKDLLYDAKDPEYPGPSPKRYWSDILLEQEKTLVLPVLTDLGLLSVGSTSAARDTCAGGTEVIKALIDHLAQGLQKWVGWQEKGDECCLKGTSGKSKGIGKECKCVGGTCCSPGGSAATTCHDCRTCGTSNAGQKCYLSAYCKTKSTSGSGSSGSGNAEGDYYWPTISSDSTKVHLLARIFLGSVCLIWSGLSQLGFLTGGSERWDKSSLHSLEAGDNKGLGSFMAAMGYDLDRLNGSGPDKKGQFVQKLLSGTEPSGGKGIQWKEFAGKSASQNSVAEYYSSIYGKAKEAGKGSTESICKDYPLLVLHILASGYFRAGSAGAKNVILAPKAAPKKEETPSPRKPRTIREILYWLSALPYSQGYKELVDRMQDKTDQVTNGNSEQDKDKIQLYDEKSEKTELKQDCLTHYLMAACGYCPLVLIGIQGTIATSGTESDSTTSSTGSTAGAPEKKQCPEHSKDRNKRCILEDANKTTDTSKSQSTDGKLKEGQVCYGGYHLEVKDFGPLHGMYANGLFGFQMDMSSAQCLDQLRVYVYHCFYQLYFLRKQCGTGVVDGSVLGWKSCRYGFQVSTRKAGVSSGGADNKNWKCKPLENGGNSNDNQGGSPNQNNGQKCNCLGKGASQGGHGSNDGSPLQSFLCDSIHGMHCHHTVGSGVESYPPIEEHMNKIVTPSGQEKGPHKHYPELCPVPMGWSTDKENHFKDLKDTHKTKDLTGVGSSGTATTYPAHCTGNTLSHLLEYYCDPEKCHGSLVVLLRLLACITPTVPRTLGDLFGFYYYIVYIGGKSSGGAGQGVHEKLKGFESEVVLYMGKDNAVVGALTTWNGDSSSGGGSACSHGTKDGSLKTLFGCKDGTGQCSQYLSPLSGQQYGQLSPVMAGTYLSWLVYLIGEFQGGLGELRKELMNVDCKGDGCQGQAGGSGCGNDCRSGSHGTTCSGAGSAGVCKCTSVVSCTGVLPVLYKYGFGYGDVSKLHNTAGAGSKKCDAFLTTLNGVLNGQHIKHDGTGLHHEINQLIYITRRPWIFVLTVAWLVAVLYLAFGAIWPLDWTHMRSHCRGWFRKGSLSPWEILMVGNKKGRGILEFFGGR